MIQKRLVIFVVALCFLMSGHAFAFGPSQKAYKKQLKRWTKQDEVYQREDFHASLTWHATWLTPEFLESWAKEQARIYDLDDAQTAEFLQDLQNRYTANTNSFFVTFYSYSFKESDLSSPKAVWKLTLESDSQTVSPVKIEKVSKPTSYYKRIFNYIDVWSSCYFVSFPKSLSSQDAVNLKVNGPTGKGQLQWNQQ